MQTIIKFLADPFLRTNFVKHFGRRLVNSHQRATCERLFKKTLSLQRTETEVVYGMFKGLHVEASNKFRIPLLARLIGTFEYEIQPFLHSVSNRNYNQVVNIGCAEAFYAVALAKMFPQSELLLYESEETKWDKIWSCLDKNKIENETELQGLCTVDSLKASMKEGSFVFSDCEGAEVSLLDPAHVPHLKSSDLLVELHTDKLQEHSVFSIFWERFRDSHQFDFVSVGELRKPTVQINGTQLTNKEMDAVLANCRDGSFGWLFLQSNTQ